MNSTLAKVLGEDSEASNSPEERKEVQLARAILAATRSGNRDQIISLASELIRMHDPATAASYQQQNR